MDALQATTASAIQTLGDETSALRHEEATLREQLNSVQEAIAGVRATLAELENQRSSQAPFADAPELRALSLRLDTVAARIESTLAVQFEAIGWLAKNHWTTGP